MSSVKNSLIVQLATAATADSPRDDALSVMMNKLIRRGMQNIAEMNEVGFDTLERFDPQFFNATRAFVLQSKETGTRFVVLPRRWVGSTLQVAAQLKHGSGVHSKHFYKMTLRRANDGSIRADVGW